MSAADEVTAASLALLRLLGAEREREAMLARFRARVRQEPPRGR